MRLSNFIMCFSVIFLALGLGYGRLINQHQHPSICDPWRREGCRSEKVCCSVLACQAFTFLPLSYQQTRKYAVGAIAIFILAMILTSTIVNNLQHVFLKMITDLNLKFPDIQFPTSRPSKTAEMKNISQWDLHS